MEFFEIKQLFPSNLYLKKTSYKDLTELTEELKIHSYKKPNIKMSSVGGYQARFNNDDNSDIAKKVKNLIITELNDFPEFNIETFWLNINYKNNYNIAHTHPNSDYSGVFYLKIPENSGSIRFQNQNSFARHNYFEKLSEEKRKETCQYPQYQITPKTGDIILFPSDLVHYVTPNESQEERISLAFNIKFL